MTDDAELRALREQVQALKARQASFRLATVVEPLPATPVGYVRVQVPGPGLTPVEMDLPHPEDFLPPIGAEVTLGMSGHTPFVTAHRGAVRVGGSPAGVAQASINAAGQVQCSALSVNSWPNINAADYNGLAGGPLNEILDRLPRGVIAVGGAGAPVAPETSTEVGWYEINVIVLPGREYRISTNPRRMVSTVAGDTIRMRVRNTSAVFPALPAKPTVTSTTTAASPIVTAGDVAFIDGRFGSSLQTLNMRLLLTYARVSGSGLVQPDPAGDSGAPATLFLLVEDIGRIIANYSTPNTGSSGSEPPAPRERVVTVSASWAASFRGDGTPRTGFDYAGHGNYGGPAGNERSLIGFPAIPELVGAEIKSAKVVLFAQAWRGLNSQGTAVIGTHGMTAPPATVAVATGTEDQIRVPGWPEAAARTIDLSALAMQGWATGALRGVRLGLAAGFDPPERFAGRFAGPADPDATRRPQLSITYVI